MELSQGMMSPAEQLLSVRWNQEMEKLQREADELKQQAEAKQKEAKKMAMGIQVRGSSNSNTGVFAETGANLGGVGYCDVDSNICLRSR